MDIQIFKIPLFNLFMLIIWRGFFTKIFIEQNSINLSYKLDYESNCNSNFLDKTKKHLI
jgi:hypothetical protein